MTFWDICTQNNNIWTCMPSIKPRKTTNKQITTTTNTNNTHTKQDNNKNNKKTKQKKPKTPKTKHKHVPSNSATFSAVWCNILQVYICRIHIFQLYT